MAPKMTKAGVAVGARRTVCKKPWASLFIELRSNNTVDDQHTDGLLGRLQS